MTDLGKAPRAMLTTIFTGASNAAPAGSDRDALASKFQHAKKFAGVPPGSIVRPRQ
jgi:hypothetical protein